MIGESFSHYKIIEKLGQGGMGVVYKAEDTRLLRVVALKFLPHDINPTSEQFERFMREAQAAATLNHSNVCVIHAIEDIEDERFIVMEYVDGNTLRVILQPGPLQIKEAVRYAIQIADALHEAHGNGIIHRDVKSENIMVNSKNQIKVMDFGLARLKGVTHTKENTSTGGTLAYMSPEQVRGEEADAPSDIWSFGIVAYEMVTGRLPFFHEYEAATLYSILNAEVVPPGELRPEMPAELEQIILRCLHKDIAARYDSAGKLVEDLKSLERSLHLSETINAASGTRSGKTRDRIERKQATIVQFVITGYNELIKKINQEDIPHVLNDFHEVIGTTIRNYEGTLHRLSENSATAFWGLPNAVESAPQKAINATIEMRSRLLELSASKRSLVNLGIRGGINTGQVIAGSVGNGDTQEYSVVGDAVDVASSLLDSAGENEIVVGSSTFKYTREDFKYKQLRPVALSGKRDPVQAYLLLSERERRHRAEPGAGRTIYSDMVGRDKELDRLEFHLLKVINGQGGIVSIIGDAGFGKSRLTSELRKKDAITRVALFEGRSLSTGKNLGFHPIIDVLRNWAGISEEDSESQACVKLEDSIMKIVPESASEMFPFIATLMGFKLKGEASERVKGISGDALNKLTQKSFRDLIIGGSRLAPVVILIEDLHWSDQSSIDLLRSLFRLAENYRVLFINTFRSNFKETSDRLLAGVRERYAGFHDEIYLQPLDDRTSKLLMEKLLKVQDLPSKLNDAISRAEGNPFFIEEVLRSLIDDGVLVEENGHFAVTAKINSAVIPATIQDVLMSRIDRLDDESRSLLKTASVMGRFFLYDVLGRVEGGPANLDGTIAHLKNLQLVRDSNRNEERELAFVHALVQELVYNTLVAKTKKELHLKVADAIEAVFNDRLPDFYGMLAFHYSAGGDIRKAEDYLFKAGERTFNTAASHEAINYLQEAISLYVRIYGEKGDRDKLFTLEKNLGLAFYNKGYWSESLEHFKKALSHKGMKIETSKVRELFGFILNLAVVLKDLYIPSRRSKGIPGKEVQSIFDILYKAASVTANFDTKKMFFELVNLLRLQIKYQLQPTEGYASYAYASGIFSYSGLSFALSRKFMQRANKYARSGQLESVLKDSEHELMLKFLSGDWENITDINEKYVEEKLKTGDLYSATLAISWAIYVANAQGHFQRSLELIEKQEEIAEAFDFAYARLFSANFSQDRHLARRDLRGAIRAADKAVMLAEQLGFTTWLPGTLGKKAKALVLSGDFEGAKKSLDRAGEIMARSGRGKLAPMLTVYYLTYTFWFYVGLLEKRLSGDAMRSSDIDVKILTKKTLKAGQQAIKISRKVAETRSEAYLLMGKYFWLTDNQRRALRCWKTGIRAGEQLGAKPDVGRIYREVGTRLLERNSRFGNFDGLPPRECLTRASRIFQELGLERDLEAVSMDLVADEVHVAE